MHLAKMLGKSVRPAPAEPAPSSKSQEPESAPQVQREPHMAQVQQVEHQPLEAEKVTATNNNNHLDGRELEQLSREAQELRVRARKLHLEVDEKNEIIGVLRDELETSKELGDKYQRENLQLLKDAKRVKFLQDENDFLQDKLSAAEKLEVEIRRLKERLQESDFLRLRVAELEEDRAKAQEESADFEQKWRSAEAKLTRVGELEAELNKWKSFSHELEIERNSIQNKLLESIEQETKLQSVNKQVEDEICRLRSVIKSFEEQRDEEQASNSFIMSAADLKHMDHAEGRNPDQPTPFEPSDSNPTTNTADTSIKYELDKQIEKELEQENKTLKDELARQEARASDNASRNDVLLRELEDNKKLISELRQDLACEKNLVLKLNNQLTSFTKQIKTYKPYYSTQAPSVASADKGAEQQSKPISSEPFEAKNTKVNKSSLLLGVTSAESASVRESHNQSPLNLNCTNQIEEHSTRKGKSNNGSLEQDETSAEKARLSPVTTTATHVGMTKTACCYDEPVKHSIEELPKNVGAPKRSNKDNGYNKSALDLTAKKSPSYAATNKSVNQAGAVNLEKVSVKNGQSSSGFDEQSCLAAEPSISAQGSASSDATESVSRKKAASNLSDQTEARKNSLSSSRDHKSAEPNESRHHVHANTNFEKDNDSCSDSNLGISIDIANLNANDTNKLTKSSSIASSSPVSSTRSQTTSPSVAVSCTGHDSGFQSINHDFNQISSPSADASRKDSSRGTSTQPDSAIVDATSHLSARSRQPQPWRPQQIAEAYQSNRSMPITATTTGQKVAESQVNRKQPDASVIVIEAGAADRRRSSASSTPTEIRDKPTNVAAATDSAALSNSRNTSTATVSNLVTGRTSKADESHRSVHQQETCARLTSAASEITHGSSELPSIDRLSANMAKHDGDDNSKRAARARALTPGKSTNSSKFVRNSLPSRSVNFGHSRPTPAYLDKIRASVTATTTTNSILSFKEQQTRNVFLTSSQRHLPAQASGLAHGVKVDAEPGDRYWLNCMLDHQHTRRCFVDVASSGHLIPQLQSSQVVANNYHDQHTNGLPTMQSSRQLNALIDPASQEHLMMRMMQTTQGMRPAPGIQQSVPLMPGGVELSEQQLSHLASLHHQHYFHHLQHMHQLHQLHHQHHLHLQRMHQQHHCQRPPQTQQASGTANKSSCFGMNTTDEQLAACQRIKQQQQQYPGGSQFQAPVDEGQLEQFYANVSRMNHKNSKQVGISPNPSNQTSTVKSTPPKRTSPSRAQQSYNLTATLPQIDEINGLPNIVNYQQRQHRHNGASPTKSTTPAKQDREMALQVNLGNGDIKQQHRSTSATRSPTSDATNTTPSSPTSTGSSNLSPSSASSSSSLNSLSASVPMNRSALRHTTSNISRRQFSVERDLINNAPMTATLSRVGSCRASKSTNDARLSTNEFNEGRNQRGNSHGIMREPLASQQPSMRTSKILNIGSQQQAAAGTNSSNGWSQDVKTNQLSQQTSQIQDSRVDRQAVDQQSRVEKLAANLANIKLNDRSAFSSLRVPRGTPVGSILRAQATATTGTAKEAPANLGKRPAKGGGGNSAVWFEYGCV